MTKAQKVLRTGGLIVSIIIAGDHGMLALGFTVMMKPRGAKQAHAYAFLLDNHLLLE